MTQASRIGLGIAAIALAALVTVRPMPLVGAAPEPPFEEEGRVPGWLEEERCSGALLIAARWAAAG
jgi:hypothetical protein